MGPLAYVEIDLSAIAHNVREARRLIGPDTRLYVVVKGDAYGVGIEAAADTMARAGADGFAAGSPDEAIQLRLSYPHLPVLLYGTYEPRHLPELASYGITPTLFSLDCVESAVGAKVPMSAFLEVDCGFGRLGLLEAEVPQALESLARQDQVRLIGLYTHLGQVETPQVVRSQADRFSRIGDLAAQFGFAGLERMVASSRVLLTYPELRLTAVNPGRLLYGLLDPPWREQVNSLPAFRSIRSSLIQVKDLSSGERLGYGGVEDRGRSVISAGVAAIGFAAGLPREMGGAAVLIRGHRAPVLGLSSMEHLLIDLTEVPFPRVGDEVVLVGQSAEQSISGAELAQAVGLTELELLPRLGRGLPRRYMAAEDAKAQSTVPGVENPSNRNSLNRCRV